MSTIQHPKGDWDGAASGPRFADLLRLHADRLPLRVHITVQPWDMVGGYTVEVELQDEPEAGWLYEVTDWVNGVRVLDPHGEDMSTVQGIAYFEARSAGQTPAASLRSAVPRGG